MKLTKNDKLILEMIANKNLQYVKSKNKHTLFRGNEIWLETKTQRELIEKLQLVC